MLNIVLGKIGSGKSAYLTRLALKAMKAGRDVFSSYPIIDKRSGITSYELDRDMLLNNTFPEDSLLIIDEAGSYEWFNSRNWKNFEKGFFEVVSTHRHIDIDILMGVQDPSRIDVSLRTLGEMYTFIEPMPLGLKRITYYFTYEDIGKPPEMCFYTPKTRIACITRKTLTSYDTKHFAYRFHDKEYQLKDWGYIKVKYITRLAKYKRARVLRKKYKARVKGIRKENFKINNKRG
jgi:hypothetical protein